MKPITIAIAGTTERTVRCAEAVRNDARFNCVWVLTPEPRAIGRKQLLTPNPLAQWAATHAIHTIELQHKITESVAAAIQAQPIADFLLVVDFGYLVPEWLLNLPKHGALNIHPSDLPRWRGSSPAQFILLYGEKNSAVCLMEMSTGMDEGPILHRESLAVQSSWTQQEYYAASFARIAPLLPDLLVQRLEKKLPAVPQPVATPTPIARRLTKQDGYVPWEVIQAAQNGARISEVAQELSANHLLSEAAAAHDSLASLLDAAARALSPWPVLWTKIPTAQGEKRMQLLSVELESTATKTKLKLITVKVEGKAATAWNPNLSYF